MEPIYTRGKPRYKKRVIYEPETYRPAYHIPDDFVLLSDTREQKPLFDPPPAGLTIVRRALKHGDYSIQGFEDKVAVERKKMSDLMSYIGIERERTCLKLEAMRGLQWKALVVEEDYDDLFLPKKYSRVPAEVVRQALVSFNIRFGLHMFTHKSREVIERWVLDRLLYLHKQLRKV